MNRGDVVKVDWQYSDLSGSKIRPAVVVQADFLNGLIDDTILIQVTSSQFGIPNTEVVLDPTIETLSGLSKKCVANCMNFMTADQAMLLGAVGVLSDVAMIEIEKCLKAVLDLR